MTSRDTYLSSKFYSELVQMKHKKVKKAVKRLVGSDVLPSLQVGCSLTKNNGYWIDKRSAIILTAFIAPEFSGKVFDEYERLS